MPLAPYRVYTTQGIMPQYEPPQALNLGISLAAFQLLPIGTIMGFVPNTNSGVAVNAQQTITITGTPTGGTITVTIGGQAAIIPYNATAAQVLALLIALDTVGPVQPPGFPVLGPANVAVTGGPGPGTAWVVTFQNQLGGIFQPLIQASSNLTGGSTPAVAVTNTTTGQPANGYYKPYLSTNSDGSQTPTCILQYPCATNGLGQAIFGNTISGQGGMDGVGGYEWQVPAWFKGVFNCANLVGLDTNATTISVSGWRIIQGSPTTPFTSSTQLVYIG